MVLKVTSLFPWDCNMLTCLIHTDLKSASSLLSIHVPEQYAKSPAHQEHEPVTRQARRPRQAQGGCKVCSCIIARW